MAHRLGYYGDGVSFWVVSETDSGSLLVVHALFTQVGFQRGGFWEVGRTHGLLSPLSFDLSQMLFVGGSLSVLHSLPGLPVKWLLSYREPNSPALAGRFLTAESPEKYPLRCLFHA